MAKQSPATTTIDPRSSELVLAYVGDGRPGGAPARDLTHRDIARLVFKRQLAAVSGDVVLDAETGISTGLRPDHRDPDPAIAAAVIAELVASGRYSSDLTLAPAPTPEPATPAATPEG